MWQLHLVGLGDFNGDNQLDLVTQTGSSRRGLIFFENTNGNFSVDPVGFDVSALDECWPPDILCGDFDGDGFKDLLMNRHTPDELVSNVTVFMSRSALHAQGSQDLIDTDIELQLIAGAQPNRPFLILASTRGTFPGIELGERVFPLNSDPVLWPLILSGGAGWFAGFIGVLDDEGHARSLVRAPGVPELEGLQLDFAFATLNGQGVWTSNCTSLTVR